MQDTKTVTGGDRTQSVRLVIGRHQMTGFDGLSCGDHFQTLDGRIWKASMNGYGITLRNPENPAESLEGFRDLPDYHSFIRAVNEAEGRAQ